MKNLLFAIALLFADVTGIRADTKLSDGDVFQMAVSGAPEEYTREYQLNYTVDDGGISVPNVGRIKAAGFTATQLSAAIEKALREKEIFKNPTVVINVMQSTRYVTVGGAVRNPSRQPWSPSMTLTVAVAAVGGPAEFAEDKIRLVRDGKSTEYSRKALRKDPSLDPKILPNDYVEVTGEF